MKKLINLKGYYNEDDENFSPLLDSENRIIGSMDTKVFEELERITTPTWNVYAHNLVHYYNISEDASIRNLEFITKVGVPNYLGLIYTECQKLVIGHSLHYEEDSLELALNSYLQTFLNRIELRVKSIGLKENNMFDDRMCTEYTNTLNLIRSMNQESKQFSLTEEQFNQQSVSSVADNTFTIEETNILFNEKSDDKLVSPNELVAEEGVGDLDADKQPTDQAEGLRSEEFQSFENNELTNLSKSETLNTTDSAQDMFEQLRENTLDLKETDENQGNQKNRNDIEIAESNNFPEINIQSEENIDNNSESLISPEIKLRNILDNENQQQLEVSSTIDITPNSPLSQNEQNDSLEINQLKTDEKLSNINQEMKNDIVDLNVDDVNNKNNNIEDDLSLDGLSFNKKDDSTNNKDNSINETNANDSGSVLGENNIGGLISEENNDIIEHVGDEENKVINNPEHGNNLEHLNNELDSDSSLTINEEEFKQNEKETFKADAKNEVIQNAGYIRHSSVSTAQLDAVQKSKEAYQDLSDATLEVCKVPSETVNSVENGKTSVPLSEISKSSEQDNNHTIYLENIAKISELEGTIFTLKNEIETLEKSKKDMESKFLIKLEAKDREILRLTEQLKVTANSQLYQHYEQQNDSIVSSSNTRVNPVEVYVPTKDLGKKINVGFKEIVSLTDKHFTELNEETSHYVYNPLKR